MFNRNIDIDPNYYYQQGMQQPYPPYQKPRIMDAISYYFKFSLKLAVAVWLITTIYGILIAEGDSWNQKALNYFDQQRVQYQQQTQQQEE